jgi:LPXTG-site transpeptidase (sortase) family protein
VFTGKKVLALIIFSIGVFLLTQVLLPLISYKLWEITLSNQNTPLISSLPTDQSILGVSIQSEANFPAIISQNKRTGVLPYQDFKVTIPSIKLEKANVVVETNSFETHLAHLPGTALPGEKGNVFITGHSSFIQLYKNDDYKAIFANLPKVKKGDTVLVEAGGQVFTYEVKGLNIVDPKDVGVINPPEPNGRYLTLMTCVPPGLFLKRLIVLAELK